MLSNYLVLFKDFSEEFLRKEEVQAHYFIPEILGETEEKNHESIMLLNKQLEDSHLVKMSRYRKVMDVILIDNSIEDMSALSKVFVAAKTLALSNYVLMQTKITSRQ